MPSDPDITGFGKETSFADNYVYLNCEQFDTFAIDENDVLWGRGAVSSWGNITGIKPDDPYPYRLLTDVQMASTSAGTYLALRKDGSVWMWGGGTYGQLGMGEAYTVYTQGPQNALTEPVKVMEDCVYADVSDGCFAIKTDGSLWVWGFRGFNSETGEIVCYYRPVHVMDDVKYANGCFAVKTDGTLWALSSHWNDRENENTYYPEEPVQIMEDVKYAQSGSRYMVIKNDDSLWVWGDNTNGALGDGTEDYIAEPMKLMDIVVWVEAEMNGIYALKANGELWGAGSLTGEADPSADMENPPAKEELIKLRLPHKILDGVLVGGA